MSFRLPNGRIDVSGSEQGNERTLIRTDALPG